MSSFMVAVQVIPQGEVPDKYRTALHMANHMLAAAGKATRSRIRAAALGTSMTNEAATDGVSVIILNPRWLDRLRNAKGCFDLDACYAMAPVLFHELAHVRGKTEDHGREFLTRFHNLTMKMKGGIPFSAYVAREAFSACLG